MLISVYQHTLMRYDVFGTGMMEKVFKALGDPTRIRIVEMLADEGEMCVCEITERLDAGQPSVSHHLNSLKNAGLVCPRRQGQWIHYSLNAANLREAAEYLERLARDPKARSPKCCAKKVVFLCVHNSGRSQMAEAFANQLGGGQVVAESAGTQPGDRLNPVVVEAMREIGYDMIGHRPKLMTDEMADTADKVVTMGCGVDSEGTTCPVFLVPSEDWPLNDPHGKSIEEVRKIRDEIKQRVEALIAELSE